MRASLVKCFFFLVWCLGLLLINVACAHKTAAPAQVLSQPVAIDSETPQISPAITREEWTRQNEAYRVKKKEFLIRLRKYIEVDHTDPAEFVKLLGDLVGGKYSDSGVSVNLSRYVRLSGTQHPLRSASWQGGNTLDNPIGNLLLMLVLEKTNRSYYGQSPIAECITDAEISDIFSAPNWSHTDSSRRLTHEQFNERIFTASENARGFRPRFSIPRFSCVYSINVDFIKE